LLVESCWNVVLVGWYLLTMSEVLVVDAVAAAVIVVVVMVVLTKLCGYGFLSVVLTRSKCGYIPLWSGYG